MPAPELVQQLRFPFLAPKLFLRPSLTEQFGDRYEAKSLAESLQKDPNRLDHLRAIEVRFVERIGKSIMKHNHATRSNTAFDLIGNRDSVRATPIIGGDAEHDDLISQPERIQAGSKVLVAVRRSEELYAVGFDCLSAVRICANLSSLLMNGKDG